MVAQLDRVTDYESVGRGFESLPSHQERPEHVVFWSFFFCAWKGLEQHGRAAGEANNSPVGCCLVRGDHRPGMSAVEPELCSGLSFLCVEGTRTARPSHRRGKQQPGGLLFSVRGSPSRNVYRGSCGSKDFMAFCFVSHGCTVFARSVFSMSDYVGRCIALQSVPFFASGEQCQAEVCLHFRVGTLQQFQKSRHRDKGYASA